MSVTGERDNPDIYKILQRELASRSRGIALIEFGALSSLWYRDSEAPVPG